MRQGWARETLFSAVRMAYRYPWRPSGIGLAIVTLGLGCHALGWDKAAAYLIVGGLLPTTACTAWWWFRNVARPQSTAALINRRAALDQRSGGVASWLDILEHASAGALRRKAGILRPSLAEGPWWRRRFRRVSPRELGVEIVRVGWGLPGQRVFSSCEDATLRIGGPRTGKTLTLACHGLDAPGALLTTSTRLDLAEMVHAVRAKRGAVHIFNPAGLGGLSSTVRWRLLAGCEDFATATRRAGDLIPESYGENARWDLQARRILSLFLNAAASSGRSMRDVVRWSGDHSDKARDEIVNALMAQPGGGRDRAAVIREFWNISDRTRGSITTTMAPALAWMSDDRARRLGDAAADDRNQLDLVELIESGETLHLIGHEDNSALAPLIAALVAEIADTARKLASTKPRGRLDPPLTMVLDEAALVCPVPLDRWTADMGGRGVTIHICVQSLSQLRQRWGDAGAGTILANVASFMVFGGSPSPSDLDDISGLTGEHRMRVIGVDHEHDRDTDGELRGEYRWVPVMSSAQIRALQTGHVLLLRRGIHTVVGIAPAVTDRRRWKRVSLAGANLAALRPDRTETPAAPVTDVGAGIGKARRWATPLRPTGTTPDPATAADSSADRLADAIADELRDALGHDPTGDLLGDTGLVMGDPNLPRSTFDADDEGDEDGRRHGGGAA